MKIIASISEQAVVLEFLEAELSSPRFSPTLRDALGSLNVDESVIINPDLSDLSQNQARERVLGKYRGWKQNQYIFHNFPNNIEWYEAELTQDDIKKLHYINHSYWNELSKGSKEVGEAALNVERGKVVFNQNNDHFLKVADDIKAGKPLSRIIIVSDSLSGELTILEGHLRATALALANSSNVKVILGISPRIKEWVNNNFG